MQANERPKTNRPNQKQVSKSSKNNTNKKNSSATKKEQHLNNLAGSNPEEVVRIRYEFFKSGSKKLKYAIISAAVFLGINSISTYIAVNKNTENKYFATDENARYIELIKLSQPNHKATVVSQWLENSLVDTFDFSYKNMRDVLNKRSQKWFTPEGRNSLITAIDEAGVFDIIEKQKFIAQLNLTQAPILITERYNPVSKVYEWTFQVAARFTYSGDDTYTNNVIFTILVQRRSMLEDVKGLGISKIIMELTSN